MVWNAGSIEKIDQEVTEKLNSYRVCSIFCFVTSKGSPSNVVVFVSFDSVPPFLLLSDCLLDSTR